MEIWKKKNALSQGNAVLLQEKLQMFCEWIQSFSGESNANALIYKFSSHLIFFQFLSDDIYMYTFK